jgi:flagellar biosynthesis protein FlhF
MSIKRFFAKTTSDALRKVRDELGSDAVILSNRTTSDGIEILALGPADIAALLPAPEPEPTVLPALDGPREESHVTTPGKEKTAPSASMSKNEAAGEARELNKNSFRPHLFSSHEKGEREAPRPVIANHRATPNPANELPLSAHAHGKAEPDLAPVKKRRRAAVKFSSAGRVTTEMEQGSVVHQDQPQNEGRGAVGDIGRAVPGRENGPSLIDLRQVADEVTTNVLKEIKSMRGTIEQQLTMLCWKEREWRDPVRSGLSRHLQTAGFSDSLARELTNEFPEGTSEKDAISWAKTVLAANIEAIGNESEILEKGGVYALVGPTGVGKTTTTAKLAARWVVRHGADKLALLTTDGYRIGGHEQLRIYGKILGVTVHAVKDAHDLTLALAELRGKHLVLIDTVGMGQRDRMVAEQVAMLAGCGIEVKRLLLLNAAANRHTLNEVAHAYRGDGLAGAIITKLDESVVLGCALETAIRHHLPLFYTACGQRVPEDLESADPSYLVDRALDHLPSVSPFAELEDETILSLKIQKGANSSFDRSGAYLG